MDNRLEIVPEEAEVLRRAAKDYLDGATLDELEIIFEEADVINRQGKKYTGGGIINLLCNEKMAGDLLLQKSHCIDPISKVRKINHGEWPLIFQICCLKNWPLKP